MLLNASNIIRILLVLLLASNFGFSQEEQDTNYVIERYSLLDIGFSLNQAIDPMIDNVDEVKLGFKVSYFRSFKRNDALLAGIIIHNFRFDRLVQDHIVFGDFEDFDVTTATTTKMLYTGLGIRYFTSFYTDKLEPYVQGEIGVNHIYTKSLETIDGAEEGNLSYETYHASIGYMLGVGIQYNVAFLSAIHWNVNFHSSTSARYYVSENLGNDVPWDNFRLRRGQINFISTSLGITFGF